MHRFLINTHVNDLGTFWVWTSISQERSPCLKGVCILSLPGSHIGLADGVIFQQIFYVQIPERIFWWCNLLVCSTNLHIWSDIRDMLNELQLSNKLLQLDLKGFSQANPDIHFPLSPYFQGLLENKWLVLFQRDRFSYLMLLFPRKKRKENLLSSPRIFNPEQTEALCLSL